MVKPYAVVHFFKQNSYSEIPSNWLLNTNEITGVTECKWPPSFIKNPSFQMKNRLTPGDDWPIYEVKIIRYCDNLNQARQAAEDSDYSSNSEKLLGRGQRPKKLSAVAAAAAASKKTSASSHSSSDDDSNGTVPAIEMPKMIETQNQNNPPCIPTTRFTSGSKIKENNHNNSQSLGQQNPDEGILRSNSEPELGDRSEKLKSTSLSDNDDSLKDPLDISGEIVVEKDGKIDDDEDNDDDERFHTLNDKLNSCLKLLGTLIVEIKDLKQRFMASNGVNSCVVTNDIAMKVKNDLPLKSREEVSAFEVQLSTSKDYHREFIKIISQVGGATGKDYTERVLDTIFSPKFATENTWEGKRTKYKINTLKLIEICEGVILNKFHTWDKAEFAKTGINWFRLGNQRAGKQPAQVKQKQIRPLLNEPTTQINQK